MYLKVTCEESYNFGCPNLKSSSYKKLINFLDILKSPKKYK